MTQLKSLNNRTKEIKSFESTAEESVIIAQFSDELIDEESLRKTLDNLDIPAEAKLLISELKQFTIKAGNTVIRVGRRIVEVLVYLVKQNPKTATGLVIGALIGLILSSIPVIGWAIGWLVQPLFMALGLTIGFYQDISDSRLKQEINSAISELFSTIKTPLA